MNESELVSKIASKKEDSREHRAAYFLFLHNNRICHNMSLIDLSSTDYNLHNLLLQKKEGRNAKMDVLLHYHKDTCCIQSSPKPISLSSGTDGNLVTYSDTGTT